MHASTAKSSPAPAKTTLFINRNFALLCSGQAISVLGDMVFDTTLILWIATRIAHGQSWAPLAVSGVLLAAAIPMVLVGTLSGVFVDRWDKRRTMLTADAIRGLLIALLIPATGLALIATHLPVLAQLGAIYVIVALASVASQFFNPARMALIGDVVPEPLQARASGLAQAVMPIAGIIGPPVAAPFFFALGPAWALGINALSFGLSFALILAVRVPVIAAVRADVTNFSQELRAGLRFFAENRILTTVVMVGVNIMLGAGSMNALDIFFVTQNLHAAPSLYGVIGGAFGAGSSWAQCWRPSSRNVSASCEHSGCRASLSRASSYYTPV